MKIGFDAKRAFHNNTGLGNYSRTLIQSLSEYYPENEYYLFNPKKSNRFTIKSENIHEILPSGINRYFSSAWRSRGVKADIKKLNIDLYHGLSHEIPLGIQKTGIKSVVTIHDLIYKRYPNQFNHIDVFTYDRKFRYACKHADHIIAISEQTKSDIINYYGTDADKITVCYQGCNPGFSKVISEEVKSKIRKTFNLPDRFFLYVGSIIERKNLLNIVKAMKIAEKNINIPLVVIGNGKSYKQKVKNYIKENNLDDKIIFLSDNPVAKSSKEFDPSGVFPAIYQSATAMIYPSFFEGFGIPVLEALSSGLPVITSNVSCLPEAGGKGSCYVNPNNAEEIADSMIEIFTNEILSAEMKKIGLLHAKEFSIENCAANVMNVYQKIC